MIDLSSLKTGKFGDLEILIDVPRRKYGESKRVLCRCKCGNTRTYYWWNVSSGKTQRCPSCSALLKKSHGMSGSKVHRVWRNILYRCNNKNSPNYKNYGARGITVCERWNDFRNFYADMGDPPPGLSIERVDNDAGYSPENCIWADAKTQRKNQRRPTSYNTKNKKLRLGS